MPHRNAIFYEIKTHTFNYVIKNPVYGKKFYLITWFFSEINFMKQTPFLSEISLILWEYDMYICQLSYPKV